MENDNDCERECVSYCTKFPSTYCLPFISMGGIAIAITSLVFMSRCDFDAKTPSNYCNRNIFNAAFGNLLANSICSFLFSCCMCYSRCRKSDWKEEKSKRNEKIIIKKYITTQQEQRTNPHEPHLPGYVPSGADNERERLIPTTRQ